MKLLKENKAQGSIELLILVAGAVVIVSIVGLLLKSAAVQAARAAQCAAHQECLACVGDSTCQAAGEGGAITANPADCPAFDFRSCITK